MSFANRSHMRTAVLITLPVALFSRNYVSVVLLLALIIPVWIDVPKESEPDFWGKRFAWYSVGNAITATLFIWPELSWFAHLTPNRLAWAVIAGGFVAWSAVYIWEQLMRRDKQAL